MGIGGSAGVKGALKDDVIVQLVVAARNMAHLAKRATSFDVDLLRGILFAMADGKLER